MPFCTIRIENDQHPPYHPPQSFLTLIPPWPNNKKKSPNEVLIKANNIALNFRGFAVATGKYPFPIKDNVVPSSDLSGEVVSVGSHVDDFDEGDKHHSLCGCYDGVLRQYIVLPSSALVKIPSGTELSFAQLSALVCTGTTARNALYGNVPLKPGQPVLLFGTGGVSVTGLILANAAGTTTIITSSCDDELAQEVLKITSGHGANFVLENGGAGTIVQSLDAVAYGGNIAVIGFLASCPQVEMPDFAALALGKGAVVRGIMVGSKQQLEDVMRFVTSKPLNVPDEKIFGFGRDEM
ncbi:NAD(P)-binding protein [Macroventuria anomochaeta]|uniref:NAD(P)-binding protein n=1 Tax=Macroventuria anomochaeta TaxID=301207 RepID=A0ACB6RPY3_9PLEO|nr:NAD(P)-binding protein [Macroventuria anomochaeta]KAF2623941.1 NAD(P)-binding protein [Macroventuria anomochaeta]